MAKEKKGDVKVYNFGIDVSDPKYKNLVKFLDEIETGARSFVIRQILNSYVNGQVSNPMFGLMGNNPSDTTSNANTIENNDTEKEEVKVVKKPVPPQLQGLKNQFS